MEAFASDSLAGKADSSRYELALQSEFFINSNSLNTKIISRFYFGRTLPFELRKNISDRSITMNRAGFRFTNAIAFGYNSDNFKWTFSFEDKMFADARFTNDAYDLVFLGNRDYEGKTADLSNSGFRFWRYEQVKAKAAFQRGEGKWDAGISIINAHNFFDVQTGTSSLFTDTFGLALDLTADAIMRRPDPATKQSFSRGLGAAVDLGYGFTFKTINSDIKVSVQDLGFVQFNKGSVTETVDTTFHYEGFELERLFPFGDSLSLALSGDTLKSRYVKSDTSRFTTMIPSLASIELTQKTGQWMYKEALVLRPFTYAWPELRFEATKFVDKMQYSFVGQLGGYSYAGAGFRIGYNTRKTTVLLDASHIEGLIFPGLTSGILIGLRINKCF